MAKIVACSDPRFRNSMTAAIAPEGLCLLANSLIYAPDDDGALRSSWELSEPLIVKEPLPATR